MAPLLATPDAGAGRDAVRPRWRGGFEFGAASRRGPQHAENEDSHLLPNAAYEPVGVADGVGGGALGKVASRAMTGRIGLLTAAIAADSVLMHQWLLASDDAVAAEIARGADRAGASTFVAAIPAAGRRQWTLTWAGDCRAYLLTADDDLRCLTVDDTYRNLAETPPGGGSQDDPARMVGNGAVDRVNLAQVALSEGEILFLCSDGMHRFVPPTQLTAVLRAGGALDERCRRLTTAAHMNGGGDDATVVAVQRHAWFGLKHAPLLLAVVILGLCLAALAWQRFARGEEAAPVPVPASAPQEAVPTPRTPSFSNTGPPPALPSDGLRLVPTPTLASGLRPLDLAAPVKKPPADKGRPGKPHGAHAHDEGRHGGREGAGRTTGPTQPVPALSGVNDARSAAIKTDAAVTQRRPESNEGKGESQ